jgi:hypothetical protein
LATMRNLFERPWNNFHTVRTVASVFSFLMAVMSLIKL